jgi:hypothetical protein
LHFERGRIVHIEAAEGAAALADFLDAHGDGARRIGHLGIGANRALRQPIGWPMVDERVHGMLFIALKSLPRRPERRSAERGPFLVPGGASKHEGWTRIHHTLRVNGVNVRWCTIG